MALNKNNVVIYSQNVGGLHGGLIRHQQILELVKKAGFDVTVNPGFSARFRSQFFSSLVSGFRIALSGSFVSKSLLLEARRKGGAVNMLLVGRHYRAARQSILSHPAKVVIIEDAILGGQGALIAARELKVPVIAMPHNIDGLAGSQSSRKRSSDCLAIEMEALSLADRTFAISQSDAWLHQQFRIDSTVLPYYPGAEREAYFRSIRTLRESAPKGRRFLIPGSAHNAPTREGMAELLAALARQPCPGVFFDVVGTNTQALKNSSLSDQFVFHGAVEPEQFLSLVSNCTACIAYQKRGSGSLTRVLDMGLAGVPVLGNSIALRDWRSLEGVHPFRDWADLAILLTKPLQTPPIPPRPKWNEDLFTESLLAVARCVDL